MFRKIIVIGSPGSGKSTFSRKLRDITNLPLYYLDMIKHKPDRTEISSEEFDKKLNEILMKEQWIVDFPTQALPQIYQLLEKYSDKQIVIFKSRQEADLYLKTLSKKLELLEE